MNELAIHFPNLHELLQLDESLRFVDLHSGTPQLVTALFAQNPNIYDYAVNLSSAQVIQTIQEQGHDFSRLYFGQEFCQNLIPAPEDVEQAYYFSRQLEWNFTLVTNACNTETGTEANRQNLQRLHDLQPDAEVVVNDWAIMHLLNHDFPDFRPVIGRLLNKQVRLNLFNKSSSKLPIFTSGIENSPENISKAQIRAYADVSLSNPDYLDFLKSLGVTGVDFDLTPQGLIRPADGWGLNLGHYFPWTVMALARNCPTAGVLQHERTFIVTDSNCGRPCRKFNCSPAFNMYDFPIQQRGPALFVSNEDLIETCLNQENGFERLIYQPLIPL